VMDTVKKHQIKTVSTAVLNSIESHSQYFGVRLVRRSDSAG
jgi:hypothetical protein